MTADCLSAFRDPFLSMGSVLFGSDRLVWDQRFSDRVSAYNRLDGEPDKRMLGRMDDWGIGVSDCCCCERTEAIGLAEVNGRRWRFGHVIGRKRNLRIETSDADDKDIEMSRCQQQRTSSYVLRPSSCVSSSVLGQSDTKLSANLSMTFTPESQNTKKLPTPRTVRWEI
ncbi:GM12689 [Drosophila sechellia]|uniref:GM12689 n=1 Tax=Drosophila sechellia TaxID=7238 RepID=B4I0Z3_DROSE|nr:GM12689 [Drosophila sechellia]